MADSQSRNKQEDTASSNPMTTTDDTKQSEEAPTEHTNSKDNTTSTDNETKEDIENYNEIAAYQSEVYGNDQMIIKKNKQKQKEQQEKEEKKQYTINNSIHFDDPYDSMTTEMGKHYYPSLSTGIYGIYCINNTNEKHIVTKVANNDDNVDEETPLRMKQRIKIMFDDNDEESDVILSDEEEEEEDEQQDMMQNTITSLTEQLKLEKNKNLQLQIAYEKHKINAYTQLAAANQSNEDLQVLMKTKDEEILSMYLQLNEERNKIVDLNKNQSLLQSEIDTLKQSLSQQKVTNTMQQSQIKELNEESKEYKISVKRANDDNLQIQNSFNEMNKIVSNLHTEITEWKAKTDELESKNAVLYEEVNSLKQKINELETNNVKLEEANKGMNVLKARNDELESSTSKLFISLENGLSFDADKSYRWYHDNNVVKCVKVNKSMNSNMVTGIHGDIEPNVAIHKLILCPILKELDDVCQYVIQLRVNTEVALNNLTKDGDNDNNEDNDAKQDMDLSLTRQQSVYNCIICTEAIPNMFNYPCGHCCYCQKCAYNAIKMDPTCPNCREQIIECKQMFKGGFRQ